MTPDQLDREIDARMNHLADGRPFVEWGKMWSVIGVPFGSWWALTRELTEGEKPRMFRAGGALMVMDFEARQWAKGFVRKDLKRFGVTT